MEKKHWTKEEEDYIRKAYATTSTREMMKHLDVEFIKLRRKICQMKLTRGYFEEPTNPDEKRCSHCKEIKKRTEFYKNANNKDKLSRYCKDCDKQSSYKLNIIYGRNKLINKRWTKEDEEILRQNYATANIDLLAKQLGSTRDRLLSKVYHMGLMGTRKPAMLKRSKEKKELLQAQRQEKKRKRRAQKQEIKKPVQLKVIPIDRKQKVVKRLPAKITDYSKMRLMKINNKTQVYVPLNATEDEVNNILKRYQKTA